MIMNKKRDVEKTTLSSWHENIDQPIVNYESNVLKRTNTIQNQYLKRIHWS